MQKIPKILGSASVSFPNNCPINERTADGTLVGRCWHHAPNGICERHGDVNEALATYRETGRLTPEKLTRRSRDGVLVTC